MDLESVFEDRLAEWEDSGRRIYYRQQKDRNPDAELYFIHRWEEGDCWLVPESSRLKWKEALDSDGHKWQDFEEIGDRIWSRKQDLELTFFQFVDLCHEQDPLVYLSELYDRDEWDDQFEDEDED